MRVAALVNYKLVASPITLITRKQAALTKREHRLSRCLSLNYLLIRHLRNWGGVKSNIMLFTHLFIFSFTHLVATDCYPLVSLTSCEPFTRLTLTWWT